MFVATHACNLSSKSRYSFDILVSIFGNKHTIGDSQLFTEIGIEC